MIVEIVESNFEGEPLAPGIGRYKNDKLVLLLETDGDRFGSGLTLPELKPITEVFLPHFKPLRPGSKIILTQ